MTQLVTHECKLQERCVSPGTAFMPLHPLEDHNQKQSVCVPRINAPLYIFIFWRLPLSVLSQRDLKRRDSYSWCSLFSSSGRSALANTVLTVSVSTARTSKFSHLLRLADNFWWWVTIRVKQSYTGAGKCLCDHVFVFSSAPHSASFLVLFQATAPQPGPVAGRNTGGAWKKKNWFIYDVVGLHCLEQLS